MDRIIIIAFLSLLCGLTALADTLWVDVNDTTKLHSVFEAVDSAGSGDVVYIANGVYKEDTTVTINNKNSLTILGEDPESTIVICEMLYYGSFFKILSDSITIQNLTLCCRYLDYKGNPGLIPTIIRSSGERIHVSRCSFHDGIYGWPNLPIRIERLGGGVVDSCNFLTRSTMVQMMSGSDSLYAEDNYWSATDSATIEDVYIEDGKDNQNAGYVKFVPFAQTEF
ncbi:MAG: hypothetical protein J7L71_03690 [Spirochaetaceae bacterium]|nr:hypothetical protein [Spirochaetaceae bacterium]